ncbi:kinase-like domain-containing protein [Tanacetum coccineum]
MVGPVAYKLELPVSNYHSTFHISNLKKCLSDESLIISMKELRLDDKLNFVEEPIEIIDREVKQLKRSRIPIVKAHIPEYVTGHCGISCGKRRKQVTALRLESQGLEGSLSPHVGNLSFLRTLSLWNNSFQGTISHELGHLARVRYLYLYDNKFNGVSPTNLSSCSNLEDLWLAQNKLVGRIPNEMSLLSKLNILIIEYNTLTGGIPPFLGNITSMVWFSAAGNPFGGSIPDTLGHWKSLTVFYSGECNLYGNIPHSIFNLSLLVNFSLCANQLRGSLPSEIGNQLPNLEWLQLRDNKLRGVVPPSLSNCSKLGLLEMGNNDFSGKLTIDLSKLQDMYKVYLANTNFNRRIQADDMRSASDMNSLVGLTTLDLGRNRFKGKIPTTIGIITSSLGECISITEVYRSGNIFQGIIQSSLRSLGGLQVPDISQNNLSGKIPQFLDKWVSLEFLNLSFNDFEGEVPVVGVFANASAFSVLGNNRLCGGLVTLELPKCKERGTHKTRFPSFIFVIVIASTLLIVLGCMYLLCKKKRNSQLPQSSGMKVLHLQNRGAHKSFLAECEAWWNIRYCNLLKIITSCSSVDFQGNDFKAMVYEFMSNGSVHDCLHSSVNTSKLNLLQRMNILRDVATALDYLHNRCQTTIVHGDLKPRNILPDDDMVAHVGDFGLARLLGIDLNLNSSTGVKGTIGYAPPEYGIGSDMTSSGDIYSFGILLLHVNEGLSLNKFAYMALPDHVIDVIDNDAIVLQSTEANAKKVEECLAATIKIGVSCSVDSPQQRMKIEIVVNELQRILDVLQNIQRTLFSPFAEYVY